VKRILLTIYLSSLLRVFFSTDRWSANSSCNYWTGTSKSNFCNRVKK